MAEKEATVFIVDVGKSMGEKRHGREQNDLEYALQYVWDRVTSTMALDRKTTFQAVVALRTNATGNPLAEDDDSYAHISVLQELQALQLDQLQSLRRSLVPGATEAGDAVSAIVLAIHMIERHCRKLKYLRRIVLITDACGPVEADADQRGHIGKKIREEGIALTVLGVDFDDDEYGFYEVGKKPTKAANEATLHALVEACGGVIGTLKQAVDELGMPRLKTIKPVTTYKGPLSLGNTETDEVFISINVERYPRVSIAKPPSSSAYAERVGGANGAGTAESSAMAIDGANGNVDGNDLVALKTERMYEIVDGPEGEPKRVVPQSELVKGYTYGRTAVHISESDLSTLDMKTKTSLQILGFIERDKFERYMAMSTTNVIVAPKSSSRDTLAISSVIHALQERESYAIARMVTKDGKPPVMMLLAPSIEPDFECLIEVQLPFAEDVRPHRFPPLDRVVTVGGKVVREHRRLPTPALQKAVDDYVDSMDLTGIGEPDEEGNPTEYAAMQDTYSPMVHRLNQAIRWRAVHPTEPVPDPYPILTKYSHPPEELVKRSKGKLQAVIDAANVKKVDPKAAARGFRKDAKDRTVNPAEYDPEADLHARHRADLREVTHRFRPAGQPISPANAIPELRQALANPSGPDAIPTALQQMGAIIESRVRDSFGGAEYERAVEELGALREEMVALEEWERFNGWVRGFRERLLGEEVGGDRREFWWRVRRAKWGLISREEVEQSPVTEQEQREFLRVK